VTAPVSFLLVGAGAIAQSYVQAFKDSKLARLVAVADPRREAADAVAAGLGCQAFSSHEAALREARFEAAIVCTPPATHADVAVALAGRGVHVMCEKPLSIDLAGAHRMVDAASRAGVLLTMASKFRYVADVIEAKSIVASGLLGEIILFENTFTSRVDMSRRWNADPAVSGGGVLIDNGTHSVDIARYFLGPLAAVQAVEGKRVQSLAVEDTARMFLRSKAGVVANVDLSWTLNKERDSYIDIYGSDGTVRVGWKSSQYRHASNPNWIQFGNGYDKVAAFRKQVENFCLAVRGEEPPGITSEDAIASVQVIEAAYRSLAHQDWVAVNGGR
jgi:predicted dehydrogenase